jgi:hypothetical protein
MEILAFIGLALILWFVGRSLSKIGNSLDAMADAVADRYISPKHLRKTYEADRVISIRKVEDLQPEQTLQDEIDQLEKIMNNERG